MDAYRQLDRPITLSAPSGDWEQQFSDLKLRIMHAQSKPEIIVDLQHVGSTALGFIQAKPIIDIAIGCRLKNIDTVGEALRAIDFVHVPEFRLRFPYRELFYLGSRTLHIAHSFVVEYDSDDWKEMIWVRDYLMINPKLAKVYERAKIDSARSSGNSIRRYSQGKSAIYRKIYTLARNHYAQ